MTLKTHVQAFLRDATLPVTKQDCARALGLSLSKLHDILAAEGARWQDMLHAERLRRYKAMCRHTDDQRQCARDLGYTSRYGYNVFITWRTNMMKRGALPRATNNVGEDHEKL